MKQAIFSVSLALAPAALLAFALGACNQSASSGKDAHAASSSSGGHGGKGGNLQFAVDTIIVESKKLDYFVQAPGTLDAFERVQVTARLAGVIDKVSFTEGQQVKKGDVLAIIESERYSLAVDAAKATLDKATASLGDAQAMVDRRVATERTNPGLVTGEELATYKTKVLQALADVETAKEAVKLAQVNLRDSYVRAPMTGVIQTRTVETGQYVQAGTLLGTLLRNDPTLLRFQVEPSDAPRLKPGMIATFTMRETQRTYKAKLTLVSGAADAAIHTVAIVGEVIDEGHAYWLRPGSFCDVTIDIGATRDVPLIPRTAARATDHGYIVYVVKGDVATERGVTLGMNTKDGWIEVRSGLAAGDQVVVHGAEALSTGVKVNATTLASFAPTLPSSGPPQPSSEPPPEASASHHRASASAATP
ncbi:MAG: efflux RND transporter periplasmic adaptor subunit [Polyangiales bacterium]